VTLLLLLLLLLSCYANTGLAIFAGDQEKFAQIYLLCHVQITNMEPQTLKVQNMC